MRRRSTFVHGPDYAFDPSEIVFKPSGRQVLHPGLKAAREERLTFGLSELVSDEIRQLLEKSHELHVRWIPETSPGSVSPFASRLTGGLHVHYTPLKTTSSADEDDNSLCPVLKRVFSPDLKCHSVASSFSRPDVLSDRFSSAASLQYYSLLPSLSHFVAYVQQHICPPPPRGTQCFYDAALLNIVDYLDLDYDSISHALTLTAFWSKPPPAVYDPIGELTTLDQWPVDISSPDPTKNKVELGVFGLSQAVEPDELQLSGVLTVVGEDSKPKPVQFAFPSRHRILSRTQAAEQEFSVAFQKPEGLHPTLEIKFKSATALVEPTNKFDSDGRCALHAYLTLPSSIFADADAFLAEDVLFQQSHNIRALRSLSGELDLEAPDYVTTKWGSAMLLELVTPEDNDEDEVSSKRSKNSSSTSVTEWKVTIPLHLRYLLPSSSSSDSISAESGHSLIKIPWPHLFWACSAPSGTKFPTNPFDRTNLGYDGLFGPRTGFFHLKPALASPDAVLSSTGEEDVKLVETIFVPVLDSARVGGDRVIERGTLVVILLGFAWVMYRLWPGLMSRRSGQTRPKPNPNTKIKTKVEEQEEEKKKK